MLGLKNDFRKDEKKMNTTTKDKKKKESAGEQIRSITLAILIALLIRSFLFQPFVIPSGSMKPNLLIGDFLFVTKYSYGFTKHSLPFSIPVIPGKILDSNKPKIGEVVVFRGPFDPDTDYIKRVVGLPGDVIQMRDGILHINDVAATVEPACEFVDDLWVRRRQEADRVPRWIRVGRRGPAGSPGHQGRWRQTPSRCSPRRQARRPAGAALRVCRLGSRRQRLVFQGRGRQPARLGGGLLA